MVNSWSDYRWPPRFCKCKLRCIEQKQAKNLPYRSCRRPVLYPAELWSHILRKRHADMFRREKKPAFCTENKPLLTGYILCVRLAVERQKQVQSRCKKHCRWNERLRFNHITTLRRRMQVSKSFCGNAKRIKINSVLKVCLESRAFSLFQISLRVYLKQSKISSISTNAAGLCVKKPWATPHNSRLAA